MTFAAALRDPRAVLPTPKRDGPDYWPTPPCLRAVLHQVIPTVVPPGVGLWEPSAGDGRLIGAFTSQRRIVLTDLHPQSGRVDAHDFLAPPMPRQAIGCWAVTNPPYRLLSAFIERGLRLLDQGDIAGLTLLVRSDHITAAERAEAFNKASRVDMCAWRPRWVEGSTGNGRWSNAWVTWQPDHDGPPAMRWWRRP